MDEQEKLLTAKESAEIIGVHEVTFMRWKQLGEAPPPAKRVNGRDYYLASELRAWMCNKQRNGVENDII